MFTATNRLLERVFRSGSQVSDPNKVQQQEYDTIAVWALTTFFTNPTHPLYASALKIFSEPGFPHCIMDLAQLWSTEERPIIPKYLEMVDEISTSLDFQITTYFRDIQKSQPKNQLTSYEDLSSLDCWDSLPFSLSVRPSTIPNAGNGLFFSGIAMPGQVVALFPGISYLPPDMKFIPGYPFDMGQYLFSRFDNVIIDARPLLSIFDPVDDSIHKYIPTLDEKPKYSHQDDPDYQKAQELLSEMDFTSLLSRNPLSLGHYINHPPKHSMPNVFPFFYDFTQTYQDLALDDLIPVKQTTISPGAKLGAKTWGTSPENILARGVVYLALSEIEAPTDAPIELFNNYRYNPRIDRPDWYIPIDQNEEFRRWNT